MRTLHSASLFALLLLCSCAAWDPDYQPAPDDALRDLLASSREASELDAVDQEGLQFAVERLATRHPSHVPSQVAAAALALERGQPQRAQGYVDRALKLEPGNVEARCLRVRIAVGDGSLDLARKLVDDGLRMRPDAAALYESSAWLHQLDGRHDDALRALDAASALGAPAWRVAYHRGLVQELRGDLNAAEACYRDALADKSDCTEAQQRLAGIEARRRLQGDG